jgi:DNA-binding MarR family transcriptional regulator
MKKDMLDIAIGELLAVPPMIRRGINRKVIRAAYAKVGEDISVPHFEIMKLIEDTGTQHIAEIGERLLIPKSQMTPLIDKLAGLNMVERQVDETDRRIINIVLTERGRAVVKEIGRILRVNFRARLSHLSDDELKELTISLRKLRDILSRIYSR